MLAKVYLMFNKTGSELNRFIQKLNLKKLLSITIKQFLLPTFLNQEITICNDYNKSDSPNYFKTKKITLDIWD